MANTEKKRLRVLVVGATSAMAMAVAHTLAARGSELFLVARNQERLEAVRRDLATRGAARVASRVLDLCDTGAHAEMLQAAEEELGGIDLALLAFGVLGDQRRAETEYAEAEHLLRTNFLATVSLVTWLANYFERRGGGSLAVISSVAGDRGRKSNYVYGASKGALNIFLEGVRHRLAPKGVQVLTIKPGFVISPMTEHMTHGPLWATPEAAARSILSAVDGRKDVAYVPGFWGPIMFVIRGLPQPIFNRMDL